MATSDSNKEDDTKRPSKKLMIIAGALVTLMLVIMGVLVVVLLKISNAPPVRQVTTIVDPNGGETVVSEGDESAKEGTKHEETLVKADAEKVKAAEKESKEKKEEKKEEKSEKKEKGGKDERPSFYKFSPAFIVNIPSNGRLRFLQVEVQLMAKTEEDVKNIESYAPVIRNDLITLFSSQNYDDLLTPDGKENLRKSALTVSRKILKDNTGKPCVEQVLFTNFVTQ